MCKVSVLVPVYNVEKYLAQCLRSICRQTLQDIEIIVINDGSTDQSRDIIRTFENDPRVRVIDKENTGYGHSMNCGLEAARGEYIGIVESDDYIEPEMFSALYHEALEKKAEVVKANFYQQENGMNTLCNNLQSLPFHEVFSAAGHKDILSRTSAIWSAIYRRDFLEKNDIRFLETPGASYQDTSFNLKVMMMADRIVCLEKAYLHYRVDNPASSVHDKKKVYYICEEYEEAERYLEKRPEKASVFLTALVKQKYCGGYRWNFHRIDDSLKKEFLYHISREAAEDERAGFIDPAIWTQRDLHMFHLLLSNQEQILFKDKKQRQLLGLCRDGLRARCRGKQVYIYGAGLVGREILHSLRRQEIKPVAFLVSHAEGNPSSVEGIPVCVISERRIDRETSVILVAVKESSQLAIVESLEKLGFTNYLLMSEKVRKSLCLPDATVEISENGNR